jgi:OmpR family response regulator RpaB
MTTLDNSTDNSDINQPTVLIVDDDVRLAQQLELYLQKYQFTTAIAYKPSEAFEWLSNNHADAVILDVMLPEMDGFDVCKKIRQNSDVPVVMLTARGEPMDRIIGLEIGADDYLPKPFEPRELVARINAILKRVAHQPSNEADESKQIRFKDLLIDTHLQQVIVNDKPIKLTNMEYKLLEILASEPGKPYNRDDIMNLLRGIDADIFSRAIDVAVSRLRQKLKPTEYIQTVWGSGYAFIAPSE